MPNNGLDHQAHQLLEDALMEAESIKKRMESGVEVSEEELNRLAQSLAAQLNQVRQHIEQAFGPIDNAKLSKQLETQLPPEEFEAWKAEEAERNKLIAEQSSGALKTNTKGDLR